MKKIQCEACGGNDIIKEGDFFVCQHCGCKYKPDDVKKLLVEGKVEVTGTVRIDNTPMAENYLNLSVTAYNSKNSRMALDYANRALEITPQNPDVWFAKMRSLEFDLLEGAARIQEVIMAGSNALTYVPRERWQQMAFNVYAYQMNLALNLINSASSKLLDMREMEHIYQSNQLPKGASRVEMKAHKAKVDKELSYSDERTIHQCDEMVNSAVQVVMHVPEKILADMPMLINTAYACSNAIPGFVAAKKKRYSMYGKSFPWKEGLAWDAMKTDIARKARIAGDMHNNQFNMI